MANRRINGFGANSRTLFACGCYSHRIYKMSKEIKIKAICENCGKEMPVDTAKSNKNWKVYKEKCACGGRGKVKIDQ